MEHVGIQIESHRGAEENPPVKIRTEAEDKEITRRVEIYTRSVAETGQICWQPFATGLH